MRKDVLVCTSTYRARRDDVKKERRRHIYIIFNLNETSSSLFPLSRSTLAPKKKETRKEEKNINNKRVSIIREGR